MTGLETAVLRAATTAAGMLLKAHLGHVPGAGLTDRAVRPAARRRRPAQLGEPEIRRLAAGLADRLGAAADRLPEHERLAALDAVADAFAFAGLGTVDADALFAADLDPAALAAALPVPPGAGLSPAAEAACRDLIRLACLHAVEYLTTLPGFGARADVELVRRTGELARAVDRLGTTGTGAAYAFEERYAHYVAEAHGRLQLFGLTTGRAREEWPLDLAYISLAVSGEQQQLLPGEPGMHQSTVKAEQALGAADRVLLRGPAGSGKSTLVQWLALNAARQTGGPWSTCVPFVLRLRSFTTAENLPLPEEFLKSSGVPLSAPPGWVEDLMLSGRALVLIDGVDEVPQRLRTRTETWLRSLVSAFPKARYVVTTRPSAVPEDWLAGQGFTPHSLLPMEREDVAAFVAHWHRAARAECGAGPAGEDLDAYEAALLEAVSARRDLGRLATNPLMCALLCALNRDRRMQLPRARKELYDAALDMLLVRRDTEREIAGVEGVYLTRDEQILLLQRFAYWLIRNGQVEAGREEAVELVAQWLEAMPQVREQGGPEQVFAHLLIRSGLLREPVKGSVDFVHRTFQDYLGAKAAVESRDFGVLVKNAHDDTWDDVVRMAVGHARPDERTRLLRGLLRRADKVKGARSRLVLLAAACLEHAPELDPSLRGEIQSRTAELLPPRTPEQAEELAKAGELVLELLPGPEATLEDEAAACIRTAALIGGPRAMGVIARFRHDARTSVGWEVARSWQHFDAAPFADEVLADTTLGRIMVMVRTPEQLAALAGLRHVESLHISDAEGVPEHLADLRLKSVVLFQNGLTDLGALTVHEELSYLGLYRCPNLSGLAPLTALPQLKSLMLANLPDGLDFSPLAELRALDWLSLATRTGVRRVSDLPAPRTLTTLVVDDPDVRLDSLEPWPGLKALTLMNAAHVADLTALTPLPGLHTLGLMDQQDLDPAVLLGQPQLTELHLNNCHCPEGLEALRDLPELRRLTLAGFSGGHYDLSPLTELHQLEITLGAKIEIEGAGGIPPERIRRLSPW
ncbi:NACHT domain-containing NTPase [Streptomyces sp. NBC_00091]|uniref:NACHT domain-containing protein n=1 Tax=Streptomyces sp. NBC_00091 TaxID=2975648 RepID=UPI002258A7DC|nr:NACHT domain-containing protein [Streptomyces sp. NBC_00091]MCX5379103.1 NACHT domain-containing protein [Streptomyces sp. NBC_00091]